VNRLWCNGYSVDSADARRSWLQTDNQAAGVLGDDVPKASAIDDLCRMGYRCRLIGGESQVEVMV
jgi:hypothetical protein